MALTFLPFIIFSALCAFGSHWFIEQKEQVQWLCERHVLNAQKHLTQGLQHLVELNPTIQTLVLEKKFITLALIAAPTPAEKALLSAQLAIIRQQLITLKLQQQVLLNTHETLANTELLRARSQLKQHVRSMETSWNTTLHMNFINSTPKIQLLKKRIDPLATLFLEHSFLEKQQQINVEWQLRGNALFPQWLHWLTQTPLMWKEECGSIPKKENSIWNAKLILAKF